jgi:hypothetical protein
MDIPVHVLLCVSYALAYEGLRLAISAAGVACTQAVHGCLLTPGVTGVDHVDHSTQCSVINQHFVTHTTAPARIHNAQLTLLSLAVPYVLSEKSGWWHTTARSSRP